MVQTPIQIRFSDLDGLRHVNNTAILSYYDLGLSEYLTLVGITGTLTGDGVAKVHVEMNFHDSILLDNNISVRTKVIKIGNKSLSFFQEILDTVSGSVKSDCTTVMAGFNALTHKSAEIREEWKNIIKEHEKNDII